MRDLTVATTHTYYVVAGTTPVLVAETVGGVVKNQLEPEPLGSDGIP